MAEDLIKDVRKQLGRLCTQLGLCLALPKDVLSPEAATNRLAEMRAAIDLAESILRRDGKIE